MGVPCFLPCVMSIGSWPDLSSNTSSCSRLTYSAHATCNCARLHELCKIYVLNIRCVRGSSCRSAAYEQPVPPHSPQTKSTIPTRWRMPELLDPCERCSVFSHEGVGSLKEVVVRGFTLWVGSWDVSVIVEKIGTLTQVLSYAPWPKWSFLILI